MPFDAAETERLVRQYAPYVHWVLNRKFNLTSRDPNYDDCYQVGWLAVYRGLEQFNENLGIELSTYLTAAIRNNVNRELVLARRHGFKRVEGAKKLQPLSLSLRLDPDKPHSVTLADLIPDRDWLPEQPCSTDYMERLFQRLSPRAAYIMRQYFVSGYTMAEIGAELKITRSRTQQIIEKSLKSLRLHLTRTLSADELASLIL